MKPDFYTMPRKELLTYCKAHRDDNEAWGIYLDRRFPDETATWYPAPLDEEGIRIGEEAIRQKIQELENQQRLAG